MKRTIAFAYGLLSYLMFLGVFLYLIGFMADIAVPKSINSGSFGSMTVALLINLALIALFGLQHSVMARPAFKRRWTQIIPKSIERSTYVLLTNLVLILLFWQWRPITATVWDIQSPFLRGAAYGLFASGWLTVLITTFLINHFDLFGLRQVWLHLQGKAYTSLGFVTPGPYRLIRHPLYVGWAVAFWATPTMTAGHLLFATGMTFYMLIAIPFEERDLVAHHGTSYAQYRRKTPMFIPRVCNNSKTNEQPDPQTASTAA